MEAKTLLAAATLTHPEFIPGTKHGWLYDRSGFAYRWVDKKLPNGEFIVRFNPLTNPADAHALWRALALKAIIVAYDKNAESWYVVGVKIINTEFKTDIEAMLSAVETLEAMK